MSSSTIRTLLVVSVALLPVCCFSQIDSLRRALQRTTDPLQQVRTHNALAWDLRDIRPDSSLYHAINAVRMADELGFVHEAIEGTNYMGVAHRNLSNYSEAFEFYLEALRRAQEHDDGEQIGYSLINIGNLHWFQTNYKEAVSFFERALKQAEDLGNERMRGYCYVNLGRAYLAMTEFTLSEDFFKKALDTRHELGDDHGIKAVQIDLADLYRRRGDLDEALSYSLEVAKGMQSVPDARTLLVLNNTIARIYLDKGDPMKGESHALEALTLAREHDSPYDEKEILLTLSDIYRAMGLYEKALASHVDYAELNQRLFSEESIRRIEQLRNQRRMQQQEADFQLSQEIIERQRVTIIFTIAGIVLFVILAGISYRAYIIRSRLSNKIERQKNRIQKDKGVIEQQSRKLRELDEAKSRFFANVSHDLRSPLSLIMGNLEMIAEDEQNALSPQSKKNLEVGFKNSKRLLHLTDEINDITRLEEGKIQLNLEKVKINSYLRLLCDMFRATADYKGVHLDFESEVADSATLAIDPRQFEKIFYNLVSNAIRHTREGESIVIGARREGADVVLCFADTGEGIPEKSLPYVFDRFYQSKDKQYKSREGLGIGLALVKELVDLHDGSISVESELKKGTTFTIRFHNQEKAGVALEATSSMGSYLEQQSSLFKDLEVDTKAKPNLPIADKTQKHTVLIVDDHPEIRYYIRQVLEHDFLVMEASHGLEAIDLLKNKSIDLIVTDLMMPWMDGFELIAALNENEELKKIPLLVVSARISEDTKEKVLNLGVNEYLQKPFQKNELRLRIENLLSQRAKYGSSGELYDALTDSENLDTIEKGILNRLEKAVKESIDDPRLSVLHLADAMAASERQVYRLVKKITGLTPHEYITEVRMKYVDYLIRNNMVKNASEAARSVGQRNVTTFNRQYERKYGLKPAELFN